MEDLVKRFGGILREQQKGVAMEWRKANGNNSKLLVWEREVRDFDGRKPLSGDAWGKLLDWWKNLAPSN